MYFNAMDAAAGGHISNRVNEGYAEMSAGLYPPDGRVGFMFAPPGMTHNRETAAGGMRFDVVEPFNTHGVSYEGPAVLMERPVEMLDPGYAFENKPKVPGTVELRFEGVSPMHGGEIVNMDVSPWDLNPERSVFRGHTLLRHVGKSGPDGRRRAAVGASGRGSCRRPSAPRERRAGSERAGRGQAHG